MNYNYKSRKHIDGNNLGPSYIISLGNHRGGRLWTGDQGFVSCHREWKSFDGNVQHGTEDFEGTRISFIAFTPASYHKLAKPVYREVRRLGFTAGAWDGNEDPYFKQVFTFFFVAVSPRISMSDLVLKSTVILAL